MATYFVYYKEPFINCAKQLVILLAIALGFQTVLNYVNYRSNEKIVILATLFVSAMVFSGVLSAFFNLRLMCEFYKF